MLPSAKGRLAGPGRACWRTVVEIDNCRLRPSTQAILPLPVFHSTKDLTASPAHHRLHDPHHARGHPPRFVFPIQLLMFILLTYIYSVLRILVPREQLPLRIPQYQ
ncbi:hypothetical protein C8J57DRAFT_1714933 [Mycena rebaudengoi]|nr:hypothetical protein C8J57DRAFT_1714928 [Mycena rebaudengoi]KAJ7273997.1 hypothetical protein C8J57DRAFT_1714933 [Mycena rebaudengoi]